MKRAIIIGQNYRGTENELPDCELDAVRMASAFYEVSKEYLFETTLSAQGFVDLLKNAQSRQKKNDTLLIAYSGHGTQVPSRFEIDGYNEGLVFWTPQTGFQVLIDDDLKALIGGIPGTVIIFMDSCFSGGMEREALAPKALSWRRKFIHYGESMEVISVTHQKAFTFGPRYFMDACSESETAVSTGQGGLFTNAILQAYRNGKKTIYSLMKEAGVLCGHDQTPTLVIAPNNNGAKHLFK